MREFGGVMVEEEICRLPIFLSQYLVRKGRGGRW